MTDQESTEAIVGRGLREGARLFREWFDDLTQAAERGQPTAYVFVLGNLIELLRSFDFQVSFPEINGLQTAVRRAAPEYLSIAEDYGYSPDICAYIKADVGVQLRAGGHPMGQIPKPSLAIAASPCKTYIKWAEIWERLYHIPIFTFDIPGPRRSNLVFERGNADLERDLAYVEWQVRELIELCERVTGKRFDIDKLREGLRHTNEMSRAYRGLMESNRGRPAPFNALSDGTIYLGVANAFRGDPKGARYFHELEAEICYKVAKGIGTLPEEKYRLIYIGVPCFPIFRRFHEFFAAPGAVFVFSTYLAGASGGLHQGFQYDLSNPIRSVAEGLFASAWQAMDELFFGDRSQVRWIHDYQADGIVYHGIKSCRTVSTGLVDLRRKVAGTSGVTELFLESDHMDRRVVSEGQMKNRIDAFFEVLVRQKGGLPGASGGRQTLQGNKAGRPGT
jgi:benzoyl-CoA reductase subunit B